MDKLDSFALIVAAKAERIRAFLSGYRLLENDPGLRRVGFGIVEQISFGWGRAQVLNQHGAFSLRVSSSFRIGEQSFPIPRSVVGEAIISGESTVFAAFAHCHDALWFVGEKFSPLVLAELEKGEFAAESMLRRTSIPPKPKSGRRI